VKLVQLQSVSLSHSFLSALIPLPPEPDDSIAEHFDWTQLWRSGVTINLPFSGTVGKKNSVFMLHYSLVWRFYYKTPETIKMQPELR